MVLYLMLILMISTSIIKLKIWKNVGKISKKISVFFEGSRPPLDHFPGYVSNSHSCMRTLGYIVALTEVNLCYSYKEAILKLFIEADIMKLIKMNKRL